MSNDLKTLPPDLPVPEDDGAAAHLQGRPLPDLGLASTRAETLRLNAIPGPLVLYFYPMMAASPADLPGNWNGIPGARGCTVQSLAYSDKLTELMASRATVYGVSLEPQRAQRNAIRRLNLSQVLLSDADGALTRALNLPTFEVEGRRFLRRLTLGANDGTIERVWYPIFPPGQEIGQVMTWLRDDAALRDGNRGAAAQSPAVSSEGPSS